MEIADELRDGALDAEEFIGKEFEDFNRLLLRSSSRGLLVPSLHRVVEGERPGLYQR